jgi:hypothetical protein
MLCVVMVGRGASSTTSQVHVHTPYQPHTRRESECVRVRKHYHSLQPVDGACLWCESCRIPAVMCRMSCTIGVTRMVRVPTVEVEGRRYSTEDLLKSISIYES